MDEKELKKLGKDMTPAIYAALEAVRVFRPKDEGLSVHVDVVLEKILPIIAATHKTLVPMGVTAWKQYGIKYGYWAFFKNMMMDELPLCESCVEELKNSEVGTHCHHCGRPHA